KSRPGLGYLTSSASPQPSSNLSYSRASQQRWDEVPVPLGIYAIDSAAHPVAYIARSIVWG
ncbi:unnamed protein product, partial [Fusarium graminearum]